VWRADNDKVKPLALVLATVPVLGAAAATLFMLFLFTFPWENSEPTSDGVVVVVVVGALAGLVLPAMVYWFGIASDRLRLAKRAFAIHALVAFGLLAYGFSVSQHGDAQILSYVLPVEVCGLLGLAAAASQNRRAVAT
jgi:hypothetical protein